MGLKNLSSQNGSINLLVTLIKTEPLDTLNNVHEFLFCPIDKVIIKFHLFAIVFIIFCPYEKTWVRSKCNLESTFRLIKQITQLSLIILYF